MFAKDKQTLKMVYHICIVQFVFVFLFVVLLCRPLKKHHMGIVGGSFILGVLVSGNERREMKRYSREALKDEKESLTQLVQQFKKRKESHE